MDPATARFFDVAASVDLLTDRQIADALGLSQSTICRIRKGHRRIGLTLRRRIRAHPTFARFSRAYLFPDEEPLEVPA